MTFFLTSKFFLFWFSAIVSSLFCGHKVFFKLKNHYLWRMISKADILTKLIELKPILREEYAVLEIGLFGSYADSSNTEESDIDILVVLERPIGWKFFSLEFFLESVFEKKIDLVTQNALKEQLKSQILKQVSFV